MKTSILLITVSLFFSIQGTAQKAIEVTVTGSGDPILLLSGFATNGDEAWQSTVNVLSRNHQCHVVNYAGFAGQEPIDFPWLPKVVDAIEDYILTNKVSNSIVIGHSLGGTIGIKLAANPELAVKNLIIIDALPATGALMMPDFEPETLVYDNPYNQQMLDMDESAISQMATGMAVGMTNKPEGQNQIIKWIATTDRKTFVYGYTDYLKFDVREHLKDFHIPVTILAAGKPYGEEMVRTNLKNQYTNLKEYDLRLNVDSAHFIMMDQPEWLMEQLNEILK